MSKPSRPHLRGDEGALFEQYHQRLLRATAVAINTSRDNVDEACAFAWAQLMTHDVHRETVFAWLKQVARREALRLKLLDQGLVPFGHEPGALDPERLPVPSGNPAVTPERWQAALARLRGLPERDRRAIAMRAFGWRYADIGHELGISETRVNQILSRADAHLHELQEQERPARSARVARLREVEANPPRYLRDAIGRPPKPSRRHGWEALRRDWRRLALAIEDYRAAYGVTDPRRALGPAARTRQQRLERDDLRERIDRFTLEMDRPRR
jgi:DNA-directed RNA polymerase specialized sigma24 family protein